LVRGERGRIVLAALMMATAAFASGANTVSQTEIIKNQVVDSESSPNPCSGVPGTLTLFAKNAIAHVTVNDNGFWATFTATGTATFTPTDPSQLSGSGRFTIWDGENGNLRNATATFTFHVRVLFPDGSIVTSHEVAHMSISANGINSISFDKPRLTCG
jgi:hypothetical protein